jgi:uncharacterized protein (DUF2461 family)
MTPAQAVKLFEAVSKCDGSFRVLRDIRIGKARAVYVAAVAKIEAEYFEAESKCDDSNYWHTHYQPADRLNMFRVLRDVRIGKARAAYVAAIAKIEAEYVDSMSAAAASNLAAAECRAAAAAGRKLGAQL